MKLRTLFKHGLFCNFQAVCINKTIKEIKKNPKCKRKVRSMFYSDLNRKVITITWNKSNQNTRIVCAN